MKFICGRDALNAVVTDASRAVAARSSMPVLEGIYLKAEDGGRLTVIGNDLEIAIESVIDADVREAGEVVLNAKLLARIIAASGDVSVSVETDSNNLTLIKSGNAKIEIPGIPSDDFPDLPHVDEEYSASLPAAVLKNMIETTAFAAAKTDNDPTRMGVQLKIAEHGLSMVALDGYRIARRIVELEGEYEPKEMIIPEKSLTELARIIGDYDGDVKIVAAPGHAVFTIDSCRLVTRLIEGSYTNYERIIPTSFDLELECSTAMIADSVRRASLIIINDVIKGPIKFTITDGNINVSCSTSAGSVDDNISVDTPPDAMLEIGFYNRYLQDVFNVVPDDEIVMRFNKSVNPLIITPKEGNDYMYMILPIRLRSSY